MGGRQQLRRNFRRGRLGDQHNHLRRGITRQQIQRLVGGNGTYRSVQVTAAGAQCMRDARSQLVHAAGHRLQPGAGSTHNAHRPAPHTVGKAQPNAVDDGGAAIRPK